MSMKQKRKLSFFFHQIILYIIFLGFLGCGFPKDTKEDIEAINKNTESIDESIKEIVEIAGKTGIQIIIKGANLENIIPSLNGDGKTADDIEDFGVGNPEDLFREGDSIENTLQNARAKLVEELEKMDPDDENRDSLERVIEQITEALGETDMDQ